MKWPNLLAAVLATCTLAAPLHKRANPNAGGAQAKGSSITDLDILQFALTLELLEINLYDRGSAQFTDQDFQDAGFPADFRPRLEEIISQEIEHIAALRTSIRMLGGEPTQPCTYDFPFTDAASFVNLTDAVNGLGPSAYVGAGAYVKDPVNAVAGAAIGNIETRHNSYFNSVLGRDPLPLAFQLPLTPTQAYGVGSQFIKSCPDSNPKLNAVTAFPPPLTITNKGYPLKPLNNGDAVYLKPGEGYKGADKVNAAFIYSFNTTIVSFDGSSAKIPSDFTGQGYVVLTTAIQGEVLNDSNSLTVPQALFVDVPASRYQGYNYQQDTY